MGRRWSVHRNTTTSCFRPRGRAGQRHHHRSDTAEPRRRLSPAGKRVEVDCRGRRWIRPSAKRPTAAYRVFCPVWRQGDSQTHQPQQGQPDTRRRKTTTLLQLACDTTRRFPWLNGPVQKRLLGAFVSNSQRSVPRINCWPARVVSVSTKWNTPVPLANGPGLPAGSAPAAVRNSGIQVFFPIEYRYVAADDVWLSPYYQQACAVISSAPVCAAGLSAAVRKIEPILRKHGGRPHWGKLHTGYRELRELYPRLLISAGAATGRPARQMAQSPSAATAAGDHMKLTRDIFSVASDWPALLDMAALRPADHGAPHSAYFQQLQTLLQQQGSGTPTLLLDLDRLDANIHALKQLLKPQAAYRLVVKSLPSTALIDYVLRKTGSQRLMCFHLPFLQQCAAISARRHPARQTAADSGGAAVCCPRPSGPAACAMAGEQPRPLAAIPATGGANRRAAAHQYRTGCRPASRRRQRSTPSWRRCCARSRQRPLLHFSGFMGYDAHVGKIPGVLQSAEDSYQQSQQRYSDAIALLRQQAPPCWTRRRSPSTAPAARPCTGTASSVCNDLSAGSCLPSPAISTWAGWKVCASGVYCHAGAETAGRHAHSRHRAAGGADGMVGSQPAAELVYLRRQMAGALCPRHRGCKTTPFTAAAATRALLRGQNRSGWGG